MQSTSEKAFFALVRAGLWEKDVRLSHLDSKDFTKVYRLAEEQSVTGILLAGIEHSDVKPPQDLLLQWIGDVQFIEQQNQAMNVFIAGLVDKMRAAGIDTVLVKGQGVAQCYERPLWRSCGDIDWLLSHDNYEKAKVFLSPLASSIENEGKFGKHLGMTIDSWVVELHGTLHTGLSARLDRVIDDTQSLVHHQGEIRTWQNGETRVDLPSPNNDVIFIFTHFLKHFYKGGLGLRQICDWCRLLWTYREVIDRCLLERRITEMRLMSEWKAFAAFAVERLGMPVEAMPLYSSARKWARKVQRIQSFVMRVGNMGHNRDGSYRGRYPFLVRKCISFSRRMGDAVNHAMIFPLDSLRFFPNLVFNGVRMAAKGVG